MEKLKLPKCSCPITGRSADFYCQLENRNYFIEPSMDTIFLNPMPQVSEMADFADELYTSGAYDKYVSAAKLKYHTADLRLKRLISLQKHSGRKLLDVGCSCGFFLERALHFGFSVKGLEFSKVAISKANPTVRDKIVAGDVNTLKSLEGNASYDVVTAFDIIEHTQNPIQFLKEVHEILKPGGMLVMSTPDSRHFLRYLMGKHWPMLQPMQHTVLFSRESMKELLTTQGFTNIIIESTAKAITLEYIFDQISDFLPRISKLYNTFKKYIPDFILNKMFSINIGEFIVFCQKSEK